MNLKIFISYDILSYVSSKLRHINEFETHVNPLEVSFENCTEPLQVEPEEKPVESNEEYNDESYSEDYEAYDDLFANLGK